MSHIRRLGIFSVLAAAAVALTGCIIAPPLPPLPHQIVRVGVAQPSAGVAVTNNVEYVQTAPPAPQYEVVTVSPGVGYIWTPGVWYWQGGRHYWRAGLWQRPPYGYSTWSNAGWYHTPGRGWYHNGGHWR
jgi:hypothetical protein